MLIVCHVISGLLIGYVSGSIIESLSHQYISDAPKAWRFFWRRHPYLCKILRETYFSHHVIHHVCTFREDHITQFGFVAPLRLAPPRQE